MAQAKSGGAVREEIDFAGFHSSAQIGMRRGGRRNFRLVIHRRHQRRVLAVRNLAQRSNPILDPRGEFYDPAEGKNHKIRVRGRPSRDGHRRPKTSRFLHSKFEHNRISSGKKPGNLERILFASTNQSSMLYDNYTTVATGHPMFEKVSAAPTLSDQVAQALLARIESGQFKPGEKLPPEAVLSPEFGVSRTVVREAISRLKQGGLLESRQGSGVFVSLQPAVSPLKIDDSVIE